MSGHGGEIASAFHTFQERQPGKGKDPVKTKESLVLVFRLRSTRSRGGRCIHPTNWPSRSRFELSAKDYPYRDEEHFRGTLPTARHWLK